MCYNLNEIQSDLAHCGHHPGLDPECKDWPVPWMLHHSSLRALSLEQMDQQGPTKWSWRLGDRFWCSGPLRLQGTNIPWMSDNIRDSSLENGRSRPIFDHSWMHLCEFTAAWQKMRFRLPDKRTMPELICIFINHYSKLYFYRKLSN